MKKYPRKSLVLLIALSLLLTVAVGGTVAYLKDRTDALVNTFTPVEVDTVIKETFEGGSKSSIKVLNKKDEKNIPVYVRVAVNGYWADASGNVVAPWTLGDEYVTADWTKGTDGFYYYDEVLAVGVPTDEFLAKAIDQTGKPEAADHLVVNVVHQSIQAAGWPAGVDTAQEAFAAAAESVRQEVAQ